MSWEKVKLGEVLFYEQPTKYIVASDNYNDEFKIPVLTAGKSFILGYTNETEGIFENLPVIIFDDFTADSKYVDFRFKVKSSAMKILQVNKEKADLRFLFYLMQTLNVDCEQHKRYWISKFAELEIPLPPLPTQKRIAEILDAADALRRNDQELLRKYDELAQAIFIDMFGDPVKNEKGWEVGRIRDVALEVKYGTSKPAEENGQYPYLRMNNITYEGNWDFRSLKYINLSEEELEKYIVRDGDLVFNRTNSKELVGKTAVFDFDKEMAIAGYLIRVRFNERANPYYISSYLNSKHGKKTLIGMCKSIVGMANINAQELQEIRIMIPPINLQNEYSELFRKIQLSKSNVITQINNSNKLFEKILQQAFKGELVK
jgi:type I restriction enzyme S subunit